MIEVENLSKTFSIKKRNPGILGSIKNLFSMEWEQIEAVKDVSFTIQQGELAGYLGPNGAGKSTTIKMLTGILRPTSGHILVNEANPVLDRRKLTEGIGVIFGQKSQLWWDLPVEESFNLLRTIYKIPLKIFKKRMSFFNDLLKIDDFIKQQTRKLSLGQRMRADLAASLLHNPPVLFLDEPTIGLDIITREAILVFIKNLNAEEKTTIILTTHDMQDIEFLASRLILIDRGRIRYDGNIDEFTAKYSKEKTVTVHLEKTCDENIIEETGFKIVQNNSPNNFIVQLGSNSSINPLINAISAAGGRIKEINVRKQDLSDTLKLIYKGKKQLEL